MINVWLMVINGWLMDDHLIKMYVNVDQCMINVWLMVFVSDDADYWLWNTTGLTDIQPIFGGGALAGGFSMLFKLYPSDNQTWLAGKSMKIHHLQTIFHRKPHLKCM